MGIYDFSIVRGRGFFGINTDLRIDPNWNPYTDVCDMCIHVLIFINNFV